MFRILRWTALALALVLLTATAAPAAPVVHAPAMAVAPGGGELLATAREWLLARFRPATPSPDKKRPAKPRKSMCGIDPDGRQLFCT